MCTHSQIEHSIQNDKKHGRFSHTQCIRSPEPLPWTSSCCFSFCQRPNRPIDGIKTRPSNTTKQHSMQESGASFECQDDTGITTPSSHLLRCTLHSKHKHSQGGSVQVQEMICEHPPIQCFGIKLGHNMHQGFCFTKTLVPE